MSEEMRRTVRTVLQLAVTLAIMAPVLISELGLDDSVPVLAAILAVSAAVTRLANTGLVDALLPASLRREGRYEV